MRSIIGQCEECCTCPTAVAVITSPVVTIETSCVSKTAYDISLCGFSGYDDGSYDAEHPGLWEGQGKKWTVRTLSGGSLTVGTDGEDCSGDCYNGTTVRYEYSGTISFDGCTKIPAGLREQFDGCPDGVTPNDDGMIESIQLFHPECQDPFTDHSTLTVKTSTPCSGCFSPSQTQTRYDAAENLSAPDTMAAAIARQESSTGTSCCAKTGTLDLVTLTSPESESPIFFDGETTSVVVSFSITAEPDTTYPLKITYSNEDGSGPLADSFDFIEITTDEDGLFEGEIDVPEPDAGATRCFVRVELDAGSEYGIRFAVPKVGIGICLRASWVERTIDEGGEGISSVSVYAPGVYRPAVEISAPPEGGTQAYAIAAMSSAGAVTGISILNPGSGYTSAPTVTVQTAFNGGTTSTGWTATMGGDQIASITGGTGGDYLPTLDFSGSDGDIAIASVTVTDSGSEYTDAPVIYITPKVTGATAADLLVHLGTEVEKCEAWDGVVPEDYDPEDFDTWPKFSTFEIGSDAKVRNIRTVCDCSACP
jgi:hypothetical protein